VNESDNMTLIHQIEKLIDDRNAWTEMAEELGKKWVANNDGDLYCIHCYEMVKDTDEYECNHTPDCPIVKLENMKKENK